jgi:hypothetical protein
MMIVFETKSLFHVVPGLRRRYDEGRLETGTDISTLLA